MSIIDIQEVSYLNQNTKPLHGIAIDVPKTNSQLDVYFLEIRGWVVGKTSQAKEVWLTYFNTPKKPLKTTPVSIPRHDVAQHYSEVSHAEKSGFSLLISVSVGCVPRTFRLNQDFQD
jgi:hypothetical protein